MPAHPKFGAIVALSAVLAPKLQLVNECSREFGADVALSAILAPNFGVGWREWGRRGWGRREWGRREWGRRSEMGSGAGVVGRGCPEVDVVDAPRDAVDVDVLGVAGCFGDDHDVVLFRRALVDVSQADHGAGGRRTEETALAAAGFDHRQSSGSGAFLGVAGSAIDARSELGVEWFGHLFRIREVGERCLAAPVECLRAATVVAQ